MFIVTVNFLVEQGYVEEFMEAMLRQAQNSLNNEDGCIQFDVCQDATQPERIFLYEVYTSDAAFAEHLKTAHFLDFDKTVKPWTKSKRAEQWLRHNDETG